MASRQKKSLWGGATFIVGLVALAVFNENVASFLEETRLNRAWTAIQPAFRLVAGSIRLLAHPIMTHLYAVVAGFGLCAGVLLIIAARQQKAPSNVEMISLPDLVDYLTTETEWAKNRPAVTEQAVQFELLDVLTAGRLKAYARLDEHGHPSPLQRVNPGYFQNVVFDTRAIRDRTVRQVRPKVGYIDDHFEHWQFQKSEVEDIWPRPKGPRTGWRRNLFGQ
jgi:hypothetical protein